MKENLGERFTILGAGISGLSAARLLKSFGKRVFLSDSGLPKADIKKEFECEFGGHTKRSLDATTIVISPGVPPDIPIVNEAKAKGIKIISEIELGYRYLKTKAKTISITGTNGKSTVCSLTAFLLKGQGYKVSLAGNIGNAFSDVVLSKKRYDFIVLELSSFQLEHLESFCCDIACCLNITPDHLDRYADFEAYKKAKLTIFDHLKEDGVVIENLDNVSFRTPKMLKKVSISMSKKGDIYLKDKKIVMDGGIIQHDKTRFLGSFNISNIMFSLAIVQPFIRDFGKLKHDLYNFKPLEHRMEFVKRVSGVTFVNDSKSTTVHSTTSAVGSFGRKVFLIAGGSSKNEDFLPLAPSVKKWSKGVFLFGQTAPQIKSTLQKSGVEAKICPDLFLATKQAFSDAKEGDIVLLSPACASFDMFDNYKHRGRSFKQIVKKL